MRRRWGGGALIGIEKNVEIIEIGRCEICIRKLTVRTEGGRT